MKIARHELLSLIEDVTMTLGQILLTHNQLLETLLDTQQIELRKQKIDSLKKRIEDEREKLAKIRHTQQRKKELERIRKDHEKKAEANETTQTEPKLGSVALRNQRGQLLGWIQTIGYNRVDVLDARGEVVAREIDGRTFNRLGQFQGYGKQGIRVLGMKSKR